MENEKRKVGDYTVLCAVNIGAREIILAENEQSTNGERFLCCYGERNDIFEKFTECAVGDDYIDATLFFAERIKQDAERFREEVEKLDIPVTVITQADCIPDRHQRQNHRHQPGNPQAGIPASRPAALSRNGRLRRFGKQPWQRCFLHESL